MMKLIEKILNQPEGKTLEFKRDLSSPKSVIKTIVAFSNTTGGMIVIGIDDDKKIIGVEDPLTIEEKLISLVADHIAPFLLLSIKIFHFLEKSLISVEVPYLSNIGPFYLKKLGKEQGTFVRLGSSSRVASREVIEELQRLRLTTGFDALPCVHAKESDLDYPLIQSVFSKVDVITTKAKLKTLKILVPYGKKYIPSNAGIILFAKKSVREKCFPNAYVCCARFLGIEKVDFLDRLDIGLIIEAVEAVPAFIRRNTRMGAIINDIKRKDIPEYPPIAVREGLLNALMHADYASPGMRTFVSIFDDRLEIRNPGSLPPGMTIEDIKEGISMPRNLVIARIFQLLGWVEQFGTGYSRIVKACAQYNYTLPEWRETGPYTDIIFKPLKIESLHASSLGPSRDPVGTQSGPSQDDHLLLKACCEAKSISELMIYMGWKNRTKFRRKFLIPLVEQGLLVMTIPEKSNSRLQKYKITEVGKHYVG